MRQRVYLETTVISYLTARPSRTLIGAAHQQLTIDWWEQRRHDFDCTHIANPELQAKLAEFLQQRGLFLPFICTPEELLGGQES